MSKFIRYDFSQSPLPQLHISSSFSLSFLRNTDLNRAHSWPFGRVWGLVDISKGNRTPGSLEFLVVVTVGTPFGHPPHPCFSLQAASEGGAFLFGSRRPGPTMGRKELKPGPRITRAGKFRWPKLGWNGETG